MADDTTYIVIVNYGRPVDTIECLRSLGTLMGARFRVVLVDNASPDDSVARIRAWLNEAASPAADGWFAVPGRDVEYDLRFIANGENGGFAAGCNVGIAVARTAPDCRYVWLLNNDTIVEPQALSALVARFEQGPRVGMCGSTLVYQEPRDIVQACGGSRFQLERARGWAIGAAIDRADLPGQAAVESQTDYVVGASMLVSKAFIETVGEMDERYFLYFEELDWAIRAQRHGYTLAWARDSVVIHKEGATIGSSTTALPSAMSVFFMTASYLRIVYAHRRGLLPKALFRMAGKAAKRARRGETAQARATIRGMIDFARRPAFHRGAA